MSFPQSCKKFVLFNHHILKALNILYFKYLNIYIPHLNICVDSGSQ